jgi:predicted DNA-binding WGR domain protein
MPKGANHRPARPVPVQLPLFAEAASLARIRPERNEWRFYRMEIWPDLFGRALLLRQWGRIGAEGRRRLDPHPDPGPRSTRWRGWRARSAAAATRTTPHDQVPRRPQDGGGKI